MAGRIRRDDIDRLRRQADMVAVVSDHTRLKRAGQRMKGLCPFHDEKTPSFTIDPTNNLYYCFGCSQGGDIFDFLMKIEGLEFVEAVEQLARRTGFTLHYEELSPGERRALGRRTRIVELNRAAVAFFRERLYSDEGAVARDYLSSRGFERDDAEHFELGFAPNDWDRLTRHLVDAGHDRDLLLTAGLAKEGRRGRIRDRFRGRLIFPVFDASGDPVGFGGRVLPGVDYGDFDPPKYYNSPETPVYRKTRVLYGLHRARAEVVRADSVLVCEGYTDVMALHQAGFGHAVATCGTAVGAEHLRVLSRYADRIVLAFDADEAGAAAAERAHREARRVAGDGDPAELRVLLLPEGLDPADLVRERGVEAVREAVEQAPPVLPFLLRRLIGGGDTDDERARAELLREALRLLDDEPDAELRRTYAETEIARPLGVPLDHVEKTAARLEVALDAHEGAGLGALEQPSSQRGRIASVDRARARLERRVLRTVLQHPEHLPDEWDEITVESFAHPKAKALYRAVADAGGAGAELADVLDAAEDEQLRGLLREVALEDPEGRASPAAGAELVRRLLATDLRRRRARLREELDGMRRETDPERWRQLNTDLVDLERRRKALLHGDG